MPRALLRVLLATVLTMVASVAGASGRAIPGVPADAELAQVRALLAVPDARWNLADTKLAIDRLVDPAVDVAATRQLIDAWAARIQARVPEDASHRVRLDVLLATLYRPGPWNDQRPFRYDLTDPDGRHVHDKLLSTYLASRQGNCVTMPVLLAILAGRLDLPVALATAPGHLLVKYRGDDGRWWNVEATSGGFKQDAGYVRELDISSRAVDAGVYLRPLAPRETTGALLGTLMEFHAATAQPLGRIAIAELALSANPRDVVALLHKASAEYELLEARYRRRYASPADIPAAQRADYERLSRDNLALFAQAEALGWTPPTAAGDAAYRDAVATESARRRGER